MTSRSSDRRARTPKQHGIVLVTFAVALFTILMFVGLALDVGFLYMTRAAMAKGTDAAALQGVRSIGRGQNVARQVAESTFEMNYAASGISGRQVEPPQVNISFSLDEFGNSRITVTAVTRVNTFIIGMVPDFARVNVSASAQAARARLIMGIALDRSGSMQTNGGAAALPGAVETFIDFFDDSEDQLALTSYADHARVDVTMRHNFKQPIRNEVDDMDFEGWTYSHGGIDFARTQINSAAVIPGENILKVLVFFTDGQANSFFYKDYPCTRILFTIIRRDLILVPGSGLSAFRNPSSGNTVTCLDLGLPTSTFFSQKYQQNRTRNSNNVEEEGIFMAERSARFVRQDGTLVFAIGLGSDSTINKPSLRIMANDISSPVFDPTQPEGVAVFAPTAGDLDDVFRQIASRILLRLTL